MCNVYYLAYSNATAYSMDVMAIRDINEGMTYKEHEVLRASDWNKHEIFYYAQVDLIKEANKGKSWKGCEVRPDQIVGHVPIPTSMTYVEPLALYLVLYRPVNCPGATIVFPGPYTNYIHTYTPSSRDIIARSELYLSTVKPDQAHGEAFNMADNATPAPWTLVWPKMCEYFGLKAEGASPEDKGGKDIGKWWNAHQDDYKKMCEEYGLRPREILVETWIFLSSGFSFLGRNREMRLDKIRSVGFTEYLVAHGYFQVLDRLVREKIIPGQEAWTK